jgi:prepilin-type processing-associated H-X9-DG protein
MSNLKQIGLGLMQYVQDYDERLPMIYYSDPAFNVAGSGWPDLIYPYVKSTQVFDCPSGSPKRNTGNGKFTLNQQPAYMAIGYGMAFSQPSWAFRRLGMYSIAPARMANIQRPAEIIWIGDSGGLELNQGSNSGQFRLRLGDPTGYTLAYPDFRHLETANFLYADGHVKSQRYDAVMGAGHERSWDYTLP